MKRHCYYIAILAGLLATGVLRASAFELKEINVHGLVSQGYLKSTENNFMAETKNGTPKFNEIAINFSTNLTNRLHIGTQVFAYTLGDEGDDKVNFDWAFADYRWRNELGLRVGKMKVVSGLYGERRQLDMLRTNIFLPFSVYLGPWWESVSSIKGVTAYGEFSLEKAGSLAYNLQGGVGNFKADAAVGKAIEQGYSQLHLDIQDMDSDYVYSAALEWVTPFENLRAKATYLLVDHLEFQGNVTVPIPPVAASGNVPRMPGAMPEIPQFLETPLDYEFTKLQNYTLSAEFRWYDILFAAEYSSYDTEGRWDMNLGRGWEDTPSVTSEGWYVSGAYRFTEWFELGMWYSEFYPNKDDKDGDLQPKYDFAAWQKTIALSTRFDINEYWIVKFEVDYNDGFGVYNIVDNPDGLERNWWLYSAKVTFNF